MKLTLPIAVQAYLFSLASLSLGLKELLLRPKKDRFDDEDSRDFSSLSPFFSTPRRGFVLLSLTAGVDLIVLPADEMSLLRSAEATLLG